MTEFDSDQLSNRVPAINFVVGILTLISPWVTHVASSTVQWDMTITGLAMAAVALITMSTHGKRYWPIINVLLGIWLLISTAFVGDYLPTMWSTIVLGVLATVTGLVSQFYEASSSQRRAIHM